MKKKWILIVSSGALVIGLAVAGVGFAHSDKAEIRNGTIKVGNQPESQFPDLARIAPGQAVVKALAAVPGRILNTGLEDENGFLVYDIEVVNADKAIVEVKVDAGSG
ncbi:MAG: PepSY domain-containing protein, partial [Desulfosarcinaceae bacterium]